MVKSLTDKEPNKSVNPDEVVAIGAALQAGILAGEVRDVLLLDVTPLSLGIETLGGIMTKIITRNTTVPVKKSDLFTTATDNQPDVDIHILQGERELVDGNKSLGNFQLGGIPEAERGVPQIQVTFDIDVDGKLSVTAKEKETGVEQCVTIHGASTLSDEEVTEMLSNADLYATADKERKESINLKYESIRLCEEIERQLDSSISIIRNEEKDKLRELINNVMSILEKDEIDNNELEMAVEKLKLKFKSSVDLQPETNISNTEQKKSKEEDFGWNRN